MLLASVPKAANASSLADQNACIGSACNPALITPASVDQVDLVPLYGGDLAADIVGPTEVIAKLAPGSTVGDVAALCAELAGHLNTTDSQVRFRGNCQAGVENVAGIQSVTAPVTWPFLFISAESEASG